MPIAAVIATLPTRRPFAGMTWAVTVDFWRGLRVYPQDQTGAQVADYGSMTLMDTVTATAAESLSYGVEAANARAIFVQGAPGISALISDGSGKPGPTLYIADTSLDTGTKASMFGASQLAQYAVPVRGTLNREAIVPPLGIHPGSPLLITDAQVALSGVGRIITSVTRRMLAGGLETWTVAFGGTRPSGTALIRKLALNPRS